MVNNNGMGKEIDIKEAEEKRYIDLAWKAVHLGIIDPLAGERLSSYGERLDRINFDSSLKVSVEEWKQRFEEDEKLDDKVSFYTVLFRNRFADDRAKAMFRKRIRELLKLKPDLDDNLFEQVKVEAVKGALSEVN